MNTRFTISTILGLALVGGCLGSAQAQSEKKMRMHAAMAHDERVEDGMMDEWNMPEPAPIGYPFAAPGGLHLYHYTDYSMEGIAESSATMKRIDNMEMQGKEMHQREKMRGDRAITDEDGMTVGQEMKQPAPIGYPFAAPAGLHLYHYTDYSMEGIAENSATEKKMDNAERMEKRMHEREKMYGGSYMTDENGMTLKEEMKEPAPIGYPFSAPGGLHLYHYTDYSMEGIAEDSATMKKSDNAEKQEKRRLERVKQRTGSN